MRWGNSSLYTEHRGLRPKWTSSRVNIVWEEASSRWCPVLCFLLSKSSSLAGVPPCRSSYFELPYPLVLVVSSVVVPSYRRFSNWRWLLCRSALGGSYLAFRWGLSLFAQWDFSLGWSLMVRGDYPLLGGHYRGLLVVRSSWVAVDSSSLCGSSWFACDLQRGCRPSGRRTDNSPESTTSP